MRPSGSENPSSADSPGSIAIVLAAAAFISIPLYVAPLLATAYVQEFGFPQEAPGFVISAEMAGMAIATFPALWWLRRLSWTKLTRGALVFIAFGNLACSVADSAEVLGVLRFLIGLFAGTVSIVCMSALRLTTAPKRSFALWLFVQLAAGAAILALLSVYLPAHGLPGVFRFFAAGAIALAWLTRAMPDGHADSSARHSTDAGAAFTPAVGIAGLLCLLAFYTAFSGLWTYLSELGRAAGVDQRTADTALALAPLSGLVGAAAAAACRETFGFTVPTASGISLLAAVAYVLGNVPNPQSFVLSALGLMFAWTFVVPFLLGALARVDQSGRLTVSTNVIIGIGLAAGPAMAGALSASGNPRTISNVTVGLCAASLLMAAYMARSRVHRRGD